MNKSKQDSWVQIARIYFDDDMKLSLNKVYGWCHWWIRSKWKCLWHEAIEELTEDWKLKKVKWRVKLEFYFYFKWRYLDSSNCAVIAKFCEDWMVENKIFAKDTNEIVDSILLKSCRIEPKERKLMEENFVDILVINVE